MTRDGRRLGFLVESYLELLRWKPVAIGADVPLAHVPQCPADDTELRTLCTFAARDGSAFLRLGCCPACGHITYVDRPAKAWIDSYYLTDWDDGGNERRAREGVRKLGVSDRKEKTVVTLAKALDVDRQRPVCEIGCGWGLSVKHLTAAGFTHVVGTEASAHRAEAVRAALGVDVFTAPFEHESTQRPLLSRAPFAVILSNHVLEHTYHPGDVLAAASRLQAEGDYLVIAVPNQQGEPPMGTLMFLPHLHSFTSASLQRLAARHGYITADDSHVHPRQLVFVFRKSGARNGQLPDVPADVLTRTAGFFSRELDLQRRHWGLRRLWWEKAGGRTGQRLMAGQGAFEQRRWQRAVEKHRYREPRSIAVRSIPRRYTVVEESPLEIQFQGPIQLFCK